MTSGSSSGPMTMTMVMTAVRVPAPRPDAWWRNSGRAAMTSPKRTLRPSHVWTARGASAVDRVAVRRGSRWPGYGVRHWRPSRSMRVSAWRGPHVPAA